MDYNYKEFKEGILDAIKDKVAEKLEAKRQEISATFFTSDCGGCELNQENVQESSDLTNINDAAKEVVAAIKGKIPTKPNDLLVFDKAITASAKKYKVSVDDLTSKVQSLITKK